MALNATLMKQMALGQSLADDTKRGKATYTPDGGDYQLECTCFLNVNYIFTIKGKTNPLNAVNVEEEAVNSFLKGAGVYQQDAHLRPAENTGVLLSRG